MQTTLRLPDGLAGEAASVEGPCGPCTAFASVLVTIE